MRYRKYTRWINELVGVENFGGAKKNILQYQKRNFCFSVLSFLWISIFDFYNSSQVCFVLLPVQNLRAKIGFVLFYSLCMHAKRSINRIYCKILRFLSHLISVNMIWFQNKLYFMCFTSFKLFLRCWAFNQIYKDLKTYLIKMSICNWFTVKPDTGFIFY